MTNFHVSGELDRTAARKVTRFLDLVRNLGHREASVDISTTPHVRAEGWARFVRAIRESPLSVTVRAHARLRGLIELTDLPRFALVRMVIPALVMLVLRATALADSNPGVGPPMGPPPAGLQFNDSQRKAAQQIHEKVAAQIKSLREETRATALAALTDQQRTLLASVVGNLSIATNPDVDAAVHQIDTTLSSAQITVLKKVADDYASRLRSTMEWSRTQFDQVLTTEQRATQPQQPQGQGGPSGIAAPVSGPEQPPAFDAGRNPPAFDAGRFLLSQAVGMLAPEPQVELRVNEIRQRT